MPDDSFRECQHPAFVDDIFRARLRNHRHERNKTCPQGEYRNQELQCNCNTGTYQLLWENKIHFGRGVLREMMFDLSLEEGAPANQNDREAGRKGCLGQRDGHMHSHTHKEDSVH